MTCNHETEIALFKKYLSTFFDKVFIPMFTEFNTLEHTEMSPNELLANFFSKITAVYIESMRKQSVPVKTALYVLLTGALIHEDYNQNEVKKILIDLGNDAAEGKFDINIEVSKI